MNEKAMSKISKIRLGLFLGAIILVLGIISIVQTVRAEKFETEAQLTKQMALISLEESLQDISANLEKTVYVSTPTMLSRLSADLWRDASSAKESLSLLPSEGTALSNTYKFLSQVGEFVMSLQRKSAAGEKLSRDERQKLENLLDYCTRLNEEISTMCFNLQNGNFSFDSITSTLSDTDSNISTLSQGFDDTEQAMSDLPSLIYDGPFSDHIENSSAALLEGLEEITEKKALEVALNCCEENSDLEFAYDENGNIECYVFQNDSLTIAVTKKGGKPLYMLNSGFAGEVQIDYDEAVEYAKEFLNKIGYSDIKESYYFAEDGICTVNFAAEENGVTMYPDLIKVSINLQNGKIMSFDATGYVSCHKSRNSLNPTLSQEEAQNKLYEGLEIIDTKLCVIPTEWQTEQYCYEIHCITEKGQELLVYIDCVTGEEDNILILLYSDGGVLTK